MGYEDLLEAIEEAKSNDSHETTYCSMTICCCV